VFRARFREWFDVLYLVSTMRTTARQISPVFWPYVSCAITVIKIDSQAALPGALYCGAICTA